MGRIVYYSSSKNSEHIIDIGDKNSSYGLLYNLLNSELKILRKYLNNVLIKKLIKYYSTNFANTLVFFVFKK